MPNASSAIRSFGSWVGLVIHLCALPFYAASGLVAPPLAVVSLLVVWLALLGVSIWAVRVRSAWGVAVPALTVGVWLCAISAGDAFLGWTA